MDCSRFPTPEKFMQATEDMEKLHRLVQGEEWETVPLGPEGTSTPTYRKLVKDINATDAIAKTSSSAASAKASALEAGAARDAADEACTCALSAKQGAEKARDDAEAIATGLSMGGIVARATFELLSAVLDYPENTPGLVTNDPLPERNGFYLKVGDSGDGKWQRGSYDGIEACQRDITALEMAFCDGRSELILYLASQFSLQSATSMRQDIASYMSWYADGIEKIGQLDSAAIQMQQRCRNAINGHVRDLRLHRLQLAAADGRTPYLFIVAGQSNAFGTNKDGAWESAHDVAKFWWWDPRDSASGELRDAVDPVHRTVYENPLPDTSQLFTGSAWPAFCRTFFELSGHKVYILNVASGGAPVTPNTNNPDNSWDVSGALRSMARTQYERLTAHLASAGLPYTLGGLLWCQGEAESERIPLGITTLPAYIDGTLDVFEFFRELTGKTDLPVFMSKIGFATYSDESDEYYHAGYTAVQNAQEQICKDNNDVHMAFRLAPDFVKLGYLSDGLHYNQTGYNMMGEALAHCAAAILNI